MEKYVTECETHLKLSDLSVQWCGHVCRVVGQADAAALHLGREFLDALLVSLLALEGCLKLSLFGLGLDTHTGGGEGGGGAVGRRGHG